MKFLSRGRRKTSDISDSMRWRSECGKYAVTFVRPRLTNDVSPYYLAIANPPGQGEVLISKHRTRNAAESACIMYEEKNVSDQRLLSRA